jgi:hypothetical protein
MNPKTIKDIAAYARQQSASGAPSFEQALAAFLMSWVAWEALRHRLLRELAHDQGWSMKDAQTALGNLRISSMGNTSDTLRKLNAKGANAWEERPAAIWKVLLGIETIRHRVVHGARTTAPAHLNAATAFVLAAVEDGLRANGWLFEVSADGVARKGPLGNRRTPHPKSTAKTMEELERLLKANVPRQDRARAEMPTVAALNAAKDAWFG